MASRSHWLTTVMMLMTSRPAAEPVSSDSGTRDWRNATALEALQQLSHVFDARVGRSSLPRLLSKRRSARQSYPDANANRNPTRHGVHCAHRAGIRCVIG